MPQLHEYIDSNRERYVDELCGLLRIPSISSSSAHKADVARCADALRREMLRIGMTRAEVFPTPGHPVVYGEWLASLLAHRLIRGSFVPPHLDQHSHPVPFPIVQRRGDSRQVAKSRVGLAHNVGGPGAVSCVVVLSE